MFEPSGRFKAAVPGINIYFLWPVSQSEQLCTIIAVLLVALPTVFWPTIEPDLETPNNWSAFHKSPKIFDVWYAVYPRDSAVANKRESDREAKLI